MSSRTSQQSIPTYSRVLMKAEIKRNQSGRAPSLKSFETDCALFPTVTQQL